MPVGTKYTDAARIWAAGQPEESGAQIVVSIAAVVDAAKAMDNLLSASWCSEGRILVLEDAAREILKVQRGAIRAALGLSEATTEN